MSAKVEHKFRHFTPINSHKSSLHSSPNHIIHCSSQIFPNFYVHLIALRTITNFTKFTETRLVNMAAVDENFFYACVRENVGLQESGHTCRLNYQHLEHTILYRTHHFGTHTRVFSQTTICLRPLGCSMIGWQCTTWSPETNSPHLAVVDGAVHYVSRINRIGRWDHFSK